MVKKKSIVTSYKIGDLVFAKVKGYSFWPARVVEDNLSNGKYKVFFFGTHEFYTLKADCILPFEDNKETLGKPKKSRGFNEGMQEIVNNPTLTIEELKNTEANQEFDENSNDSNISNNSDTRGTESSLSDDLPVKSKNSNKRSLNVSDESTKITSSKAKKSKEEEEEQQKTIENEIKTESIKGRRTRTISNDNIEETKTTKSIEPESPPNIKKLRIELKTDENLPQEIQKIVKEPKHKDKIEMVEDKMASTDSSNFQKTFDEQRERRKNMTPEQREAEKNILKKKKLDEKKTEKIKNIRLQWALLKMDTEIKKSLKLDNTDVNRCVLIMEDLIKLPITQKHLFKAPEIVDTIKKCRKFTNSEIVRNKANECFYKFRYMFEIPQGESFWSIFEKEREKYLAENVEELKKERIFANKLHQELLNTNKKISLNSVDDIERRNSTTISTDSPISSSVSSMTQSPNI